MCLPAAAGFGHSDFDHLSAPQALFSAAYQYRHASNPRALAEAAMRVAMMREYRPSGNVTTESAAAALREASKGSIACPTARTPDDALFSAAAIPEFALPLKAACTSNAISSYVNRVKRQKGSRAAYAHASTAPLVHTAADVLQHGERSPVFRLLLHVSTCIHAASRRTTLLGLYTGEPAVPQLLRQ
jgi:hypothetical protein